MTNDPDKPSMRAPRRYKIKKEEDSDGEEYQQLTWDSKLNVMDISLLDVKNCMKCIKEERRNHEEDEFLISRLWALKLLRLRLRRYTPCIIPAAADLFDYQPFRELLLDLPYIKVYHFNDAMADFEVFMNQWRKDKDRELLRIMGAITPEDDSDCDYSPLRLATTIFKCSDSLHGNNECLMVSYPRVLLHDGSYTYRKLNVNDWSSKLEEWKWNSNGQVMFNAKAHEIAKDIVTLTGLNPATATSEDMDYIDPIFSCNHVLCNFNLKKCYMRWKNAIYHALSLSHTYTAESGRHAFTLVTDVETRVYVEALLNMIKRCSQPKLVCVHCGEKGTYQEWINHSTKGLALTNSDFRNYLFYDGNVDLCSEFMDDLDVDPCGEFVVA